ncbi:MAG: hypothetical protein ACI89R_000124 [Candidatus Azotimanducaceae bacterium]|jgi:hypothetical protein
MKTYKHNFLAFILLFTTVLFAQKHDKKVSESFKVNNDVFVDITTRYADVTIETWSKNVVSIEGSWEVEGLDKEDSNKLFENVDFEASGNKEKVIIRAKSNNNFSLFEREFEEIDFNFNFDSIVNIGDVFIHDFHFEIPEVPEVPEMPDIPEMPEIVISHLSKIEFDHKAYEKDKEGYMQRFKKEQEKWEKEMEEKIEPQMKEYEKKIKLWEKENGPRMKQIEVKVATWEKENIPKIKAFEKKMATWEKENATKIKAFEEKMEKMGKKMEEKYSALIEMKHKNAKGVTKIKKRLLIKIPKNAKVKLDVRYGSFSAPDDLNTVD